MSVQNTTGLCQPPFISRRKDKTIQTKSVNQGIITLTFDAVIVKAMYISRMTNI